MVDGDRVNAGKRLKKFGVETAEIEPAEMTSGLRSAADETNLTLK